MTAQGTTLRRLATLEGTVGAWLVFRPGFVGSVGAWLLS
jgi:hypothetical protein